MLRTPKSMEKMTLKGLFFLFFFIGTLNICLSTTTCSNEIDLSLSISSNKETARTGESVTFSISVYNNGNEDATGISVASFIPSGLTNISCTSFDPKVDEDKIQWDNLEVPVNGILTFVFHAQVQATGSHITTAEIVAADQEDINSIPNNGADNDNDGLIGSFDDDSSYDADDEDDGDDAVVKTSAETSSTIDNIDREFTTIVDIAPNPAYEVLNIDIQKKSEAEVKISMYSQMGQPIISDKGITNFVSNQLNEKLDISQLSSGKYILKVQVGDESHIKRVVVAR